MGWQAFIQWLFIIASSASIFGAWLAWASRKNGKATRALIGELIEKMDERGEKRHEEVIMMDNKRHEEVLMMLDRLDKRLEKRHEEVIMMDNKRHEEVLMMLDKGFGSLTQQYRRGALAKE